jgi:hypothetical protein
LPSASLTPEVESFVGAHIDSIEQLEILLLLRLDRTRAWTAREIATEMRTTEGSATLRLGGLLGDGLVEMSPSAPPTYRYRVDAGVDEVVAALAAAYLARRFAVIDAILRQRRPNKSKIRLFAEAFRLKKRSGDDDG